MNKKVLGVVVAAGLIAVLGGIALFSGKSDKTGESPKRSGLFSGFGSGESESAPGESENGEAGPGASADAEHPAGQPVVPPQLDALREEVGNNPHGTPASLIQFAENIAYRIDEAEGNPEKARALMDELENCVLDTSKDAVRSIQALCLTNASDLAQAHPDLGDRYKDLRGRVSPEVQKLLEAAQSFE